MKVILLANWGLGLEIFQALEGHQEVDLCLVVTQFQENSADPWRNAVYDYAIRKNMRTITQADISFEDLAIEIVDNDIDLLVCHSFMRILPAEVLSKPKYKPGCINVHASLLPRYRGPSPTYWVLENGEKKTGLTCHYMDEGVDTGDIICQVEVPVFATDTIGAIIDRQKGIVKELIDESIKRLQDRAFHPFTQDHTIATYAPRPST